MPEISLSCMLWLLPCYKLQYLLYLLYTADVAMHHALKSLPCSAIPGSRTDHVHVPAHEQTSLVPCAGCGRTFRPEALEHHIKGCQGPRLAPSLPPPPSLMANSHLANKPVVSMRPASPKPKLATPGTAPPGDGNAAGRLAGSGPQGLVCYLCG